MTFATVDQQIRPAQVGASILTADLLHLGKQIELAEAAGVDFFHLDVMDGMFVPNITFGPVMIETVRRATTLPIDVHLMIEAPERYLEAFIEAGASTLTLHVEATSHLHSALQTLKRHDVRAGVTLNPATPLVLLEEVLPMCGSTSGHERQSRFRRSVIYSRGAQQDRTSPRHDRARQPQLQSRSRRWDQGK